MTPEEQLQLEEEIALAEIEAQQTTPSIAERAWDWATTRPDGTKASIGQIAQDIPIGITRAGTEFLDLLALPGRYAYEKVTGEAPPSPTYTGRLEQALQGIGVSPEETPLQRVTSFGTPLPGKKAEMLKDVGMGLLSYVGERYAGTPGAIGAPLAVALGVPTVRKLGRAARGGYETAAILAGSEAPLKEMAAREIQTQIGPESLQRLYETNLPSAIEGVPGPTLMEVIPTPETVKYQQQVIQNLPGGESLSTVMGERKAGLEKALKGIGLEETPGQMKEVLRTEAAVANANKAATTGKLLEEIAPVSDKTPEEKGKALLGALGTKFKNARESVDKVWAAIPEDEVLDVKNAQEQVAAYKANLSQTQWEDLPPKLKNWIDNIISGTDSLPRMSDKELAELRLQEFLNPETQLRFQSNLNSLTEQQLSNLQKQKAIIDFDYNNAEWDLIDNELTLKVNRDGRTILAPSYEVLDQLKQKEIEQLTEVATQSINEFAQNKNVYIDTLKSEIDTASDAKNNLYSAKQFDDLRKQGTRLYKELSTKSNAGRIFSDVKNLFLNNITAEGGGASKALPVIEQAVKAERAFSEVFREGVVGSLSSKRFNKLKTLASDAVDKVLAKPEYVTELQQKFGKNADEVIVIRQELLGRLSEQKDGNKFINKHIDLFKNSFGDDLEKVRKYADAKMTPTGYESYASVADVSIPKMIFESEKSINDFMTKFGGTGADEIAKNKFAQLLLKDKNPLETLVRYEKGKIPQTLYGEEFADVKPIIEDLARTKAPRRVEAIMTGGQSATQSRNTAIAAVKSARDVFRIAEKGTGIGAVIGAMGLKFDKVPGSKTLGAVGALIGNQIKKLAATRETEFNAIIANMLANPEMIKFAKLPPTPENTKKLLDVMVRLARDTAVVGKSLKAQETKKEE